MFKTKDAWLNFVYSIGAAIVILGALFKITHFHIGPLTGNVTLSIGLVTEAIIFIIFAFDPPKSEENYAWENVYPELLDKNASPNPNHALSRINGNTAQAQIAELETSLSQKLDEMMREARLDVSLFERLRAGLDNFSQSVDQINKTVDVSASTQRYNDQLNRAAEHMENINALYAMQLQNEEKQAEYKRKYVADLEKSAAYSEKFNEELQALSSNLNNLNRVYGGMLNAMKA